MNTRNLSLFLVLILGCCQNMNAQQTRNKAKPSLVFQYTSWNLVRFEVRDLFENEYELTCLCVDKYGHSKSVSLASSEVNYLKPILQSLKKESYSLSLPEHGVVIMSDGESVQVEINAVSLGLTYRDTYDSAKSHKPIRFLVDWIKQKFPQTSTPK